MGASREAGERGRPRLRDHDYLHLRPLADDLAAQLGAARVRRGTWLDLGAGASPYRQAIPVGEEAAWVRVDLDPTAAPSVVGRAEALPFGDRSFDAVLCTQLLGLVDDPVSTIREISRVLKPGGVVWLSTPAAWPYDSDRVEHRFGEPELRELFAGFNVREVMCQGGMLALPFALLAGGCREAVRATERRSQIAAASVRWLAKGAIVCANLAGRSLEKLAERGPLSAFLGYLDRRLPMNYLVVAQKDAA